MAAAALIAGASTGGSARAAWPGYPGRIAFYGSEAISTVSADGSGLQAFGGLSYSLGPPNGFVWSRNGKVAYALAAGDGHTDQNIHVYGGAVLEDWGENDLGTAFSPAWSPDGTRLMFICQVDSATPGSTVPTGICEAPAAGGTVNTVLSGSFDALAWSPNGDWIAYDDGTHVHVAHSDGSDAQTISGAPLVQLEWSPDNTTLIGVGDEGSVWELVPSTTSRTRLADQGRDPAWSPDGAHIVYALPSGSHVELVVANSDGTNAHVLTDPSSGAQIYGTWPRWLTGVRPNSPSVAGRPAITGTAKEGLNLTAQPGTWNGDPPITLSYAWQRCDKTGANCTYIASATTASYTLVKADVGATLRVVVTAKNAAGTASSGSDATGVVVAANTPPSLTRAHARHVRGMIRLTASVCDDSAGPIALYATDSLVANGKTLAKRTRTWTINGQEGCRPVIESWTTTSRRGARHVVVLRARDSKGAWSTSVRMTLR